MEGLQSSGPVVAAVLLGLFVILIFLFNKKSDSTVSTTAKKAGTYGAGAVAKTKAAAGSGPFTEEEVAKHNTDEDCWIIIDEKVYDVTQYIDEHPGGDAILRNAGGDSTAGFKQDHHPPTVWEVIPLYYIGDLKR